MCLVVPALAVIVAAAYTYDDGSNSVDFAVWPNCMFDCNYANTMDNFDRFDFHTHHHLLDCLMMPCVEYPAMIFATVLTKEVFFTN